MTTTTDDTTTPVATVTPITAPKVARPAPKRQSAASRKSEQTAKSAAKPAPKVTKKTDKPAGPGRNAVKQVAGTALISAAVKIVAGWSDAQVKRTGVTRDQVRAELCAWCNYIPGTWDDSLGTKSGMGRKKTA